MNAALPSVLVTGIAGNLGQRLLPLLSSHRVIGVDFREPVDAAACHHFETLDLGRESSCGRLVELLQQHSVGAVVHLAFVIDPLRTGVLDLERQWQINVAGTARVMEAIAEVNRLGGAVRTFICPSSVSAYGPQLPLLVKEDHPLAAHTLPYAIHKMEADQAVQKRAPKLPRCTTYLLRPHIFTGATMENYVVGALRGTPTGKGALASRLRKRGTRLPLLLPRGLDLTKTWFQFVHVDDVARLIKWLIGRHDGSNGLHIFNVAGRGDILHLARCAEIAKAKIFRLPHSLCLLALDLLWAAGISGVPPKAYPYMIGSYTMDTGSLRKFLGKDYESVIRFTIKEALSDSFRAPVPADTSAKSAPVAAR